MELGTKIYYCNITGNLLLMIGDSYGGLIRETTMDEDYEIYPELNDRNKKTISLKKLDFGVYDKISNSKECVGIDLDTGDIIFKDIPPLIHESELNILKKNIDKLQDGQELQNLTITSIQEAIDFILMNSLNA